MTQTYSNGDGEARPAMQAGEPWPDPLHEQALHGLPGEIVRTILPHTEADPAALLGQFIVAFGNVIGRAAWFQAEADEHRGNLNVCLCGTTSKGRKGSSLGHVRRLFADVDGDWSSHCWAGGLSSGEGLIVAVRDPTFKKQPRYEGAGKKKQIVGYDDILTDEGVADKRLLVVEPEFAAVLSVMGRERNTLSAIIRQAWDTGTLRIMTKNSPTRATGAHISIVGHITVEELKKRLNETDVMNGFANRFLWLCVGRSKFLPEGGHLRRADLSPLTERLGEAVEFARGQDEMRRDQEARDVWHEVYPTLSDGKPGLFGMATSRAEAQVMRLAMLYALLDCSPVICAAHLTAGLAFWHYADQSARFIFGSALGDRTADEIAAELWERHPRGMSRTEISGLFHRNRSASEIGRALARLADSGRARCEHQGNGSGRNAEWWFAIPHGERA